MIKLVLIGTGMGISYLAILWGLGFFLFGFGGHGTSFFLLIPSSPFVFLLKLNWYIFAITLIIIFWILIFILAMNYQYPLVACIMLLIQYVGIIYLIPEFVKHDLYYFTKVWDQRPLIMISWIVIYLAGQVFLWYKLLSPGIKNLFKF